MRPKTIEHPIEGFAPASSQSPIELLVAQELREGIEALLRGSNSRSFDFTKKRFLMTAPDAFSESVLTSTGIVCGVRDVSLFSNNKWPTPWGSKAELYKAGNNYYVEAGQVCLTLHNGTYPQVDYKMHGDSPQAVAEARRSADGFENCLDPLNPYKKVTIPARDSSLRSRVGRLEFGIFLLDRIVQADTSGKDVFLQT